MLRSIVFLYNKAPAHLAHVIGTWESASNYKSVGYAMLEFCSSVIETMESDFWIGWFD